MFQNKQRTLNVFMLAMINVAAICNFANLSISAKYGFSSLFYLFFGAIVFFIPVAIVSAELATGWPQRGGVYIWVREALGEKLGFLAVWLQWVENVIWYPAALSFVATAFAYVINPDLAHNKYYIISIILIVFWGATLLNFLGMTISGWISSICALLGAILPGIIIIALGTIWVILGYPSHIKFSLDNFFPSGTSLNEFSLMAGILISFAGMEMSAVHAGEVKNPTKNYPLAILISVIIILTIFSFGSLAIAVVVPISDIALPAGAIKATSDFLAAYHLPNLTPVIAALITIGSLGMVSTWTVGPIKGIFTTGYHGEIPPFLQKTNKRGMPVVLLTLQAIIVSILSLIFLLMPDVTSSYWILIVLTAQLYLIMYILMFIAAIVLRYKKPHVSRDFKIPFKNIGMWVVASTGILGCLFAMIMSFFQPDQIQKVNEWIFSLSLMFGIIVFSIIPFIINRYKHTGWQLYGKYHKVKDEVKKDLDFLKK
ncbi:MAG: amino acid permease [Chlamydiae bacterium]|nr:amino acid permease [Chlamydiota bacterium]